MADGTVFTGDTGIGIDNTLVGTTVFRQRIVIGSDATSSGFVNPSSVWPSSGTIGLPVRIIGSSGIVLGSVAPSTNWTVALSSGLAASTAIIGSLSSGTAQIGILGPSSANVIGAVAQSSNWNISTGAVVGLTTTSLITLTSGAVQIGVLGPSSAIVIGSVAQSSNWNLSTGAVVGLTTTSVVGLTTTSIVGLSSALSNYVTNSTAVPVFLGQSSGNVVGIVSQSSNWNISTGAVVGLTTTALVGFSTTANIISGIVAASTWPAVISSGSVAPMMVDNVGRPVVQLWAPRQSLNSATLLTAANTSQQQFIVAQGAGAVADLLQITVYSSQAPSTALVATRVMFFSSSGQAEPGLWSGVVPLAAVNGGPLLYQEDFVIPLTQPTANNPWFIVSTSSGVVVRVHAQFVKNTT